MKRLSSYLLVLLSVVLGGIVAKADNEVKWSAGITMTDGAKGNIKLSAEVANGFHFYAFEADGGGYNSLIIKVTPTDGVKILGSPKASKAPVKKYDEQFEEELAWWESNVSFTIPFEITDGKSHDIDVSAKYQACNDQMCIAPVTERFTLKAVYNPATTAAAKAETPKVVEAVEEVAEEIVEVSEDSENSESSENSENSENSEVSEEKNAAESPVPDELSAGQAGWWSPIDAAMPTSDQSPWGILIIGFIGGLAALLTPCVWPLIPMTLSFFLKRNKKKGLNSDAIIYGLSIVIIYLVLGIAITVIFGAGKLNDLSTSALFNIIFFAILVIFAISFFGAFDIKLPEKWSNAMDNKAETTSGFISIFFMAFTLVLVSFSCTGPIIGTLLVEAASQGNFLGPALGMGGFALGLAIPFTIFAIFPSMLNNMPKSGGWLNSVKVVLGFIELILSLKFLSVADLAYGWGILDREVFIALWIVLFTLLGLYLLGKIRFSHDSKMEHVGVGRFMLSLLPLSFAVYLIPGLWGAPLKATSAFAPPLSTQDFNLYVTDATYPEFDDYNEGMRYAREHGMPVLMDFSGYGCVNCRNMEVAVFDTDKVQNYVNDNFVVIKLMVDDKKPLPQPIKFKEGDKNVIIETVGEKWTYLQSHKFGASSQPYYIVLDNEGRPMNDPVFYDNDVDKFMKWMEQGVAKYVSL